jgi:hypothetical protein
MQIEQNTSRGFPNLSFISENSFTKIANKKIDIRNVETSFDCTIRRSSSMVFFSCFRVVFSRRYSIVGAANQWSSHEVFT